MRGTSLAFLLLLQASSPLEQEKPSAPRQKYEALILEWKEAVKKAEAAQASKKEDTWLCEEQARIKLSIGQSALEIARSNPGEPAALESLLWVTGEGKHRDTIGPALELLRRDHILSPRLSPVCDRAFSGIYTAPASVDGFLRAALAQSAFREVRGSACYGLAVSLELRADGIRAMERDPKLRRTIERLLRTPENLAVWRRRTPSELDQECESLYERTATEFRGVKGVDGQSLSDRAEKQLFRRRELAVGKVPPEIEGRDHDGRRFRLSDYRGQVVVLTFAFSSCSSCKEKYPQERALVAKLKSRPFALLSVNVDEDVRTLRKSIASGEVTWRCWWDGGPAGPIAARWRIQFFPSVFVLDRSGVIRFKDVWGGDLETAVTSLLGEPAAAEPSRQ